MFEPISNVVSEYHGDIIALGEHAIFGFDFSDEVYWISDIVSGNARHIPINLSKDAHKRNKISLCAKLPIFAFVDLNESEVFIVDAQLAKTISSIKIADSKIESVSLSENGETILIGGKNGILSRWNIYNKKLLNIPARHKDFVLLSKESPSGRFIVSVSYDRSVMLFDRARDSTASSIFVANGTIQSAKFFDNLLALGDSLGFIYIIELATKTIIHRFQASFSQILDLQFYKDSYLFYINNLGVVGVFDFQKEESIMERFLPQTRYKSLAIRGDLIAMCDYKKDIKIYSFSHLIERGEYLCENYDPKDACNFISQYQFLRREECYLKMEAQYRADILEARSLALDKNVALALKKLEIYAEIPDKKDEINLLISNIRAIEKFEQLMESGMEAQAIPLAQKNPLLKELRSYVEFEARFTKILLLAREFIKNGKKSDANNIAMRYKRIPSKARAVQEALLYTTQLDEAINAIKNKDYKTFFHLKKSFGFVESLKGAQSMEEDGNIIYFHALEAFYSLNLNECKRQIEVLKLFKNYKELALDLELSLERAEKLIDCIS